MLPFLQSRWLHRCHSQPQEPDAPLLLSTGKLAARAGTRGSDPVPVPTPGAAGNPYHVFSGARSFPTQWRSGCRGTFGFLPSKQPGLGMVFFFLLPAHQIPAPHFQQPQGEVANAVCGCWIGAALSQPHRPPLHNRACDLPCVDGMLLTQTPTRVSQEMTKTGN